MRNSLLRFSTVTLGIAVASLSSAYAVKQQEEKKKPFNVLFIAVDDLNDWVGFLGGNPQTRTPNMDKLAQQSMVFEKAYCAAPVSNPSRASLMTGVKPSTSGVYDNGEPFIYWHRGVKVKMSGKKSNILFINI